MATTDSPTDLLGTYLNDHLAGANAGVEMAHQLHERATDGPDANVLATLAADIEADREELRGLVERLEQGQHPVKQAAGWIASKAHQIAIAEALTGDEHVSMLLQTESLALGIDGKRALWAVLIAVASRYPALADTDLNRLAQRAREQRELIEPIRLAAANRAFTHPR